MTYIEKPSLKGSLCSDLIVSFGIGKRETAAWIQYDCKMTEEVYCERIKMNMLLQFNKENNPYSSINLIKHISSIYGKRQFMQESMSFNGILWPCQGSLLECAPKLFFKGEFESKPCLLVLWIFNDHYRRYGSKVKNLRQIFSEYGLIRFRVAVEVRWLQQLSLIPEIKEVPPFSDEANQILNDLATNFSVEDALAVKKVKFVTTGIKLAEFGITLSR